MRGERHAFFLDLAQPRQRKDLKAAGVGQNGTVPRHEFVKPAHFFHDLVARAKMQVIGVGKLDLRTDVFQVFRR